MWRVPREIATKRALALIWALVFARTAEADELRCKVGGYLEPGLFVTALAYNHIPEWVNSPQTAGKMLVRVGGGLTLTGCSGPVPSMRVGATGFVSTIPVPGGEPDEPDAKGIGVEGEATLASVGRAVIAGRMGIERTFDASYALSVGARIRFEQHVWIGIDAVHVTTRDGVACTTSEGFGCTAPLDMLLVGGGLQDRVGVQTTIATVALGALAWIFVLNKSEPVD